MSPFNILKDIKDSALSQIKSPIMTHQI